MKKTRKKYYVNHRFQRLLFIIQSSIFFSTSCFILIQIYRTFKKLEFIGVSSKLPPNHSYFNFIDLQKDIIVENLCWALLVCAICNLFAGIFITHKVMGPLFRLKIHLKIASKTGKWSPLSFRKNDLFEELPDLVNETIEKIQKN